MMIVMIAIPALFDSQTKQINKTISIRNAKTIVSMAFNASVAGAVFQESTRNGLVKEILDGVQPSRGSFKNTIFRVPNIKPSDLEEGAYRFIGLDSDGMLRFDETASQPER